MNRRFIGRVLLSDAMCFVPSKVCVAPPSRARRGAACRTSTSVVTLVQIVLELLRARGVAQLAQRFRLDLANALAGDAELAAHLLERAAAAVLQAEAELQHPP